MASRFCSRRPFQSRSFVRGAVASLTVTATLTSVALCRAADLSGEIDTSTAYSSGSSDPNLSYAVATPPAYVNTEVDAYVYDPELYEALYDWNFPVFHDHEAEVRAILDGSIEASTEADFSLLISADADHETLSAEEQEKRDLAKICSNLESKRQWYKDRIKYMQTGLKDELASTRAAITKLKSQIAILESRRLTEAQKEILDAKKERLGELEYMAQALARILRDDGPKFPQKIFDYEWEIQQIENLLREYCWKPRATSTPAGALY